MAIGWSQAVRRESRTSATVDFTRATPHMAAIGKQWAREVSATLLREMTKGMPADTGYSRGHLGLLSFDKGQGYHIGVLGLKGKHGESLAYLAMMDAGIKRHFVSFTNPDGSIREAFVNWARRHGFAVYKSALTGRATKRALATSKKQRASFVNELGMGGLLVWGYARPWATEAFKTASRLAKELLTQLRGQLGKAKP